MSTHKNPIFGCDDHSKYLFQVTRNMAKRFEIVRLPLILIIQFKRFMKDGFTQKKQNYVDFELSNLNLGVYAEVCDGKLNNYRNYQLYAVCNHFGTMEGGHYIANCYSQVYKRWYKVRYCRLFNPCPYYDFWQNNVSPKLASSIQLIRLI